MYRRACKDGERHKPVPVEVVPRSSCRGLEEALEETGKWIALLDRDDSVPVLHAIEAALARFRQASTTEEKDV
jgi:hypothetical protein